VESLREDLQGSDRDHWRVGADVVGSPQKPLPSAAPPATKPTAAAAHTEYPHVPEEQLFTRKRTGALAPRSQLQLG
jgi:hypothetical protein